MKPAQQQLISTHFLLICEIEQLEALKCALEGRVYVSPAFTQTTLISSTVNSVVPLLLSSSGLGSEEVGMDTCISNTMMTSNRTAVGAVAQNSSVYKDVGGSGEDTGEIIAASRTIPPPTATATATASYSIQKKRKM